MKLFATRSAIRKIKIDKCLVWYAGVVRLTLEIIHRVRVKIDCDLLLQLLCIRIFAGIGEIIFSLHGFTPYKTGFRFSLPFVQK